MNIQISDWIGYILTFIFGIIGGIAGDRIILKNVKKISQNKNFVLNGDIVGGDKNDSDKRKEERQ